jgi:hypothetical protein
MRPPGLLDSGVGMRRVGKHGGRRRVGEHGGRQPAAGGHPWWPAAGGHVRVVTFVIFLFFSNI